MAIARRKTAVTALFDWCPRLIVCLAVACTPACTGKLGAVGQPQSKHGTPAVQLGPRPFYLVAAMDAGALKDRLRDCAGGPFEKTDFSIGHRGAALQFPEHTRQSYEAAARMGAGILECDVTFTADLELVCRHSQCDLHTTTDILLTPLAEKCSAPFAPAALDPATGRLVKPASANCCTSDITLEEFKSLCGKMDGFDPRAQTAAAFVAGTPGWRTDLYATCGTVLSHAESIALFTALDVKMTPELKPPGVKMPYRGHYTRQDYARQMIDDYVRAGVPPEHVWPQSFDLDDVRYWITEYPEFGRQAVYLDGRYSDSGFDHTNPATWSPTMEALAESKLKILAPPMWMLLKLDDLGRIVPSEYAMRATSAGIDLIAWTLERSGPLATGGGWYYQSITGAIDNDGDTYEVLHVLAKDVGILGIFSDWPATVTYYHNCMGGK